MYPSWFINHRSNGITLQRKQKIIRKSAAQKRTKAFGLQPHAFISFLVFGNPDETLALVFEKACQKYYISQQLNQNTVETSQENYVVCTKFHI